MAEGHSHFVGTIMKVRLPGGQFGKTYILARAVPIGSRMRVASRYSPRVWILGVEIYDMLKYNAVCIYKSVIEPLTSRGQNLYLF